MHTGRFIIIEGGDGAGKDTQIELLKKDFSGPDFVYTRETGGTRLGQYVRQALFHEVAGEVTIPAEFFLILADRAQHVEEVVRPALLAGKTVISNRGWFSAYAYQIYGRDNQELKPFLKQCLDLIYRDCPLDLAVVLDIPAERGLARQKEAGKVLDTIERMPLALHERVRQGFLDTAKEVEAAVLVNADRSVEEVYTDVKREVDGVLQNAW